MSIKGNIAIFVPHAGCPNQCSFCNQKTITATTIAPTAQFVEEECKKALIINKDKNVKCEIAFFGGSFTAIPHDYMITLLKAANKFLQYSLFDGIRISTRPDCIDKNILEILKSYGVTAIELGAQSLDDVVLKENLRGHNSKQVVDASELIKEYGFSLGLQMMTGLYMDTDEKAIETAKKIVGIKPDTVRIYPTVVLENTYLDELRQKKLFIPKSVDDSVPLCAKLMEIFMQNDIKIIRVGLHSEQSVKEHMTAGAYHPAFRELCESVLYFNKVSEYLKNQNKLVTDIVIFVNSKSVSKMIGQKKSNIKKIHDIGYTAKIKIDNSLKDFEVKIIEDGV